MSVLHLTFSIEELREEWGEDDTVKGGLRPLCWSCEGPMVREENDEGIMAAFYVRCLHCPVDKKVAYSDIEENQFSLPVKVQSCPSCGSQFWHDTNADEWRCIFCD